MPLPTRRPAGAGGGPPAAAAVAVMETNDEAAACRMAAMKKGYFQDPFLAPFVDPVVPSPLVLAAPGPPQRAVDVNRGTAIRVAGVDAAVAAFRRAAAALPESASRPPQILALGAGFDTRPAAVRGVRYVEVDYPAVAAAKWRRVVGDRGTAARAALPSTMRRVAAAAGGDDFHVAGVWGAPTPAAATAVDGDAAGGRRGTGYALLGGDLRDVPRLLAVLLAGAGVGWDWASPTLLLCEVALVYMDAGDSGRLLAAIAAAARGCLAVVNFEQIRPDDPFGARMVAQMAAHGCPLRGLAAYPELVDQVRRFRTAGWGAVEAVDALTYFYRYMPPDRRRHIISRERLDDADEWHGLLRHYALVWGATDRRHEGAGPPQSGGGGGGAPNGGAPDLAVADADPRQLASPFVATFLPRPAGRETG